MAVCPKCHTSRRKLEALQSVWDVFLFNCKAKEGFHIDNKCPSAELSGKIERTGPK